MPEYQKTIVPTTEPSVLRQKLTNWAALSDIAVLETLIQDRNVKLKGKKTYRGKRRFSVGLLILWIVIGFSTAILFSAASSPNVGAVALFAVPAAYVIYHFVQNRDRTVEFEIISVDSQESVSLKISASHDFDDVKSDVNAFVTASRRETGEDGGRSPVLVDRRVFE